MSQVTSTVKKYFVHTIGEGQLLRNNQFFQLCTRFADDLPKDSGNILHLISIWPFLVLAKVENS